MGILNDVKMVVEEILKNFGNVVLDDIDYGSDAPTDSGKEIQIDLFPKDYGRSSYDVERYYEDCRNIYYMISAIVPHDVSCDIDVGSSWNFIYVIL